DPDFLLGTDSLGRDILAMIVHGARATLLIGLFASAVATLIGVGIGATAGYFGGWIDEASMRAAELFQTIPNLIFVLTIVVILGSTLQNIVIAIGIVSWTPIARMTRAEFLALRDREFVQACRSMGMGDMGIIMGEILPNALPPVIVAVPLEVRGLSTTLFTRRGEMKAVDGLTLSVGAGETVALVGESGCGKSLSALSIMRLLPDPPARIVGGSVTLNGRDLVLLPEPSMLDIRGKEIGMIFQDPMSSLNPVATVERQIVEVLTTHTDLGRAAARQRALELLEMVGMPDAARRLDAYPHQLSGGMCQRVMIAMAIACHPSVLIADEPTTALDVTVQAQVLALLKRLQAEAGLAMIFITHDLG